MMICADCEWCCDVTSNGKKYLGCGMHEIDDVTAEHDNSTAPEWCPEQDVEKEH